MTRVLLVRHAETAWNRERRWQGQLDIPLSRDGILQARRIAEELRRQREHPAALYSSDLSRAVDTARAIGAVLGLEPSLDPEWREMDLGRWAGLTREEIQRSFPDEWARIAAGADLPRGGGESFGAFSRRVVGALQKLTEAHPQSDVLVVTHAGVIRAVALYVLGLPPQRFGEIPPVDNGGRIELLCRNGCWEVRSGVSPPQPNHLARVSDSGLAAGASSGGRAPRKVVAPLGPLGYSRERHSERKP